MGEPKKSVTPFAYINIGGNDVSIFFKKVEWKSFTNGGYVIRAKLEDPYWNMLRKVTNDFYLKKGRKEPTLVTFELSWPGVPNGNTGRHIAYITDLDARGNCSGTVESGGIEFIAVDPPSYWLNAGNSSGRIFKGKVSDVIKQVLDEYYIKPNGKGRYEVSETTDSSQNIWHMNRMDPKTFIGSLLDWSSSITNGRTNWIVSCDGSEGEEPTIWIKEQNDRKSTNFGAYILDTNTPGANDSYYFEFLSDNFISLFQRSLITHGISAVSERYLDSKIEDKLSSDNKVHVHDGNTSLKKKPDITAQQGFSKPQNPPSPEDPNQWSSAIMSIPEHSGGDIGKSYDKYIDGRARYQFLNMLNLVMRIKLRVFGEPMKELANCHNLGVSTLKIIWIDGFGNPYFLSGNWLVYGFHHVLTRDMWYTDLYCARLDYDANATPVG